MFSHYLASVSIILVEVSKGSVRTPVLPAVLVTTFALTSY